MFMKKIFKGIILILTFLFVLPVIVKAEEVSSLKFYAWINADSSVKVTENIKYDFGNEQRHGIFRSIPYIYETDKGDYETEIVVQSVVDEKNQNINFVTERKDGYLRLKIGDADKYVTDKKFYQINYEVRGALNYFENHDELYWNMVGNEWEVDIREAEGLVFLPGSFSDDQIETDCLLGEVGAKEKGCQIDKKEQEGPSLLHFVSERTLKRGEGMTIVVGWPKGFVQIQEKKYFENKFNKLNFLWFFLLIIPFVIWYVFGRDEKMDTVIPEYEPPKDLSPVEGGVIIDDKLDNRDTTSVIIDLAVRGYLKIKQEEKKVLGFNKKEWSIIKTKEADDGLQNFERKIFDTFFAGGKSVYSLDKNKADKNLSQNIKSFQDLVYQKLEQDEFYVKNPKTVQKTFAGIGSFLFVLPLMISRQTGFDIWEMVLVILGILFWIFSLFMAKKTKKGLEMKRKLFGFKMFLSVTEKDRVSFHFSPEKNPEKFADYLPWAIIFGVEKEWANVFKNVTLPQPGWYDGNWNSHMSAFLLADALGGFSGTLKGVNSKSSAAAGGASGLGGGGFSGGGFGGGGGGSW
jgi:uncharacterized membrane protein